MLKDIILGFHIFLSINNIIAIIIGMIIGIIVGALPGLGPSIALAIMIPMTFTMQPATAILLLCAVYVGGSYGGSISSILINTPGTAAAAATALDGYPLAKQGKAQKALLMALYASTTGHFIGTLSLLLLFPYLSMLALKFAPPEITLLVFLALTIIASLSGKSIIKGLIAATLGMLFSSIGLDPIIGVRRFTFGILGLDSGLELVPSVIGIFALSEIFIQAENILVGHAQPALPQSNNLNDQKLPIREFFEHRINIIRSSLVGIFIGILPGIGGSTAAFFAYAQAKKASKNPKTFGEGNIEGICAAEAANNAVVSSALVPLFSLGIPGSLAAALLLGALLIHGLIPGPQLFKEQGPQMYAIIIGLFACTISLYLIGLGAIKIGYLVTRIKASILFPIVLILCVVGAFATKNSMFDLKVMFFFGILGYLSRKYEFPLSPLVIAFILCNKFEVALRQTLIISEGSVNIFFKRPLCLTFIIIGVFFLIGIIMRISKQRSGPNLLAKIKKIKIY